MTVRVKSRRSRKVVLLFKGGNHGCAVERRQAEHTERLPLPKDNFREKPVFVDTAEKHFSLRQDSSMRNKGIGAEGFPTFASPWPPQPAEERARVAIQERRSQTPPAR